MLSARVSFSSKGVNIYGMMLIRISKGKAI